MSGESMAPTFGRGERVVFERVVGVGGDRVARCTGEAEGTRVTLNGEPLQEPYLKGGDVGVLPMPAYDVRVPEGPLFLLGHHRANARDARAFLDDRGATLPASASAVRGRVIDDYTVPTVPGVAMMSGVVLVPAAAGLGIAAMVVRRKARAVVPSPPPWAVRV
ncbi:S26 family signal peptidase [Streptomyces sp. NPDC002817]|uniref:S26 family signal peptidase n=1 Tax=Streptomyces sp. NPDC088357 TaxID=3154655 RepID=UPI0034366A6A